MKGGLCRCNQVKKRSTQSRLGPKSTMTSVLSEVRRWAQSSRKMVFLTRLRACCTPGLRERPQQQSRRANTAAICSRETRSQSPGTRTQQTSMNGSSRSCRRATAAGNAPAGLWELHPSLQRWDTEACPSAAAQPGKGEEGAAACVGHCVNDKAIRAASWLSLKELPSRVLFHLMHKHVLG